MRCFLKELNYIEIGQKIKKARISMGLSQEAAAELCGLSPSFYSNIERGVKIMSLKTFISICSAFSLSADYLLKDALPTSDTNVINVLSEAKKSGRVQYEKYIKAITALAEVADQL
jgi:transcriptional regulator, XRE family